MKKDRIYNYPTLYDALLFDPDFKAISDDIPIKQVEQLLCKEYKLPPIYITRYPLKTPEDQKNIYLVPTKKFEEEIAAQRNIPRYIWSDMNFIHSIVKANIERLKIKMSKIKPTPSLSNLLKNPPDLALIDMGLYGYGVVANQNIKENDFIGFYSGTLITAKLLTDQINEYAYHAVSSYYMLFAPIKVTEFDDGQHKVEPQDVGQDSSVMIDAKHSGGYGTFFSHLPEKSKLPSKYQDMNIATKNTERTIFFYDEYPLVCHYATRPIKKGELLGFDYTQIYWSPKNKDPVLFTQFGEPTIYAMDPGSNTVYESKINILCHWNNSKTAKKSLLGYHTCKDLVSFMLAGNRNNKNRVREEKRMLKEEIQSVVILR